MRFLVLLAFACSTSPPPSGKDLVVQAGPSGEAAVDAAGQAQAPVHLNQAEDKAAQDMARFAFPCCATPGLTALGQATVALQDRLAADDGPGAQLALTRVIAAADQAAAEAPLPEADRARAAAIATGSRGLEGRDLAGIRGGLASLNVLVLQLLRDHPGGEQRVVAAFCPMAPGHWLQDAPAIRNPYYGADMLTCGTLEAVAEVR